MVSVNNREKVKKNAKSNEKIPTAKKAEGHLGGKKMNVLYCVDGTKNIYVTLLKMSMHSVMDHQPGANFHVIHDDVPRNELRLMERKFPVKFYGFPKERFKDDVRILTDAFGQGIHPSIFWRLFAPEILPVKLDQVLHVDCDMLLNDFVALPPIKDVKNSVMSSADIIRDSKGMTRKEHVSRLEVLKRHGLEHCIRGNMFWMNVPLMKKRKFTKKCVILSRLRAGGETKSSDRPWTEEDLMSVVGGEESIEWHDDLPEYCHEVSYYLKDADRNFVPSFLHCVFINRKLGNFIPKRHQDFFNHYWSKWKGEDWNFKATPFHLKPFKFVPNKMRKFFK